MLEDAGFRVEPYHAHYPDDDVADHVWITEVASRGWVALTKDKGIAHNELERKAVVGASARVFSLTSGSVTAEQMAKAFVEARAAMSRTVQAVPAPFYARVGKSGDVSSVLAGRDLKKM